MSLDERSEKLLKTLAPRAEKQARAFLVKVREVDLDARVISGTRSYAEQNALFAQGRTKPGAKVTNARGGFSNHNFAVAWDIGIFDSAGKYLEDSPLYVKAGKIGRTMGLEWGGDWASFPDDPHFQCKTGKTLAELRDLVAANGGEITAALSAINSLIHALPGDTPPPPPPPPVEVLVPVEVYLNRTRFDIKAFLTQSRVYVAAADFADYFGGAIAPHKAGDTPNTLTYGFHEASRIILTRVEQGMVYVKFADINAVLGYTFKFDSATNRLTLSR